MHVVLHKARSIVELGTTLYTNISRAKNKSVRDFFFPPFSPEQQLLVVAHNRWHAVFIFTRSTVLAKPRPINRVNPIDVVTNDDESADRGCSSRRTVVGRTHKQCCLSAMGGLYEKKKL